MKNYLKVIVLLFVAVCAPNLRAQTGGEEVEVARTIAGHAIYAKPMHFDHRIYQITGMADDSYFCVSFRDLNKKETFYKNKGYIALYRPGLLQPEWTKEVNYMKQSIYPNDYGVLFYDSSKRRTEQLSLTDGLSLWTTKANTMVYLNNSAKRLLAYENINSKKLVMTNLETGEKLTTLDVPHDNSWGWNDIYDMDSTHIICIANNINQIDLEKGTMKFHEAKTGFVDTKSAILQGLLVVATAAAGAMVGGAYIPMGYNTVSDNVVTGVTSQIYEQDSLFYIADRQEVMCLNRELNEVWTTKLPSRLASKSILFGNDTTLYMLNLGFGLRGGRTLKKTGRPFIAAFNRKTGRRLFLNQLTSKKDVVEDAFATPDHVFMLFDDGLAYQSNLNDSIVNIIPWDKKTHGKLYCLVKEEVYGFHQGDKMFTPLAYDGFNCPVMNDSAHVFVVDRQLNIRDHYLSKEIYIPVAETENYKVVGQLRHDKGAHTDFWIIQTDGIPVGHITWPCREIGIVNNTLMLVDDHSLIRLPVSNLLE